MKIYNKPTMEVVSSLPSYPEMLSILEDSLDDANSSYNPIKCVSPYTYKCMAKEYTEEEMDKIDSWMKDNGFEVGEPNIPHLGATYFDCVHWPYSQLLPRRSSERAAGYDFCVPKAVVIDDTKPTRIFLGVKCVIDPKKKEFLGLYIRSKFTGIVQLLNSVGIIDADYADSPECNGEIQAVVQCFPGAGPVELAAGDCLVQGVLQPYDTIDFDIPKKLKRHGGFGSSDRVELVNATIIEAEVVEKEEKE